MKDKRLFKWLKMILFFIGVLISCYGIYYLFDYIWNGSFVDWFENNYMWTQSKSNDLTGEVILISEINWPKFKILIMGVFCTGAVICAGLVRGVSVLYGREKEAGAVRKSSQMIRSYMEHDVEAELVFPPEFAEVAVQMSQIKAKAERSTQMLKSEEKRKNDMITYLAHDLKTPLTSVIGYLSLLDEAKDMPSLQREKFTKIVFEKSRLLERLIQEFFDITRYNLNQIILEKEPLDLSYMLVQLADEFYPMLNANGNSIDLDTGEEIQVYGDALKLARVFQNILKNAVSYSYPGTSIKVHAKANEREAVVCIQNEGRMIPKEKLPLLFDKFYRADEARSGNAGGAGLGLAIAKEIVILHGGSISAKSEHDHTIFSVVLPLN